MYACESGLGINALYALPHSGRGGCQPSLRELLWVFPPLYLVTEVLHELQQEKVNAVTLLPKGARFWLPLLQQLPAVANRSLTWSDTLQYTTQICTMGSQAPAYMRSKQYRLHMCAYLVWFDQNGLQFPTAS